MKKLIALILIFSNNIFASGGVGGVGGGPSPEKLSVLQKDAYPIQINSELIKQIDNIELDSEIKYPNTLLEKVRILNDQKTKSFQLKSGEIYMKIDKKENGPGGGGTPSLLKNQKCENLGPGGTGGGPIAPSFFN